MSGRHRVAVLISGRGSNMAALIEAAQAPDYPAEIVLVLSNRRDAAGLARAAAAGVRTAVVDHRAFTTRETFEAAIEAELIEAGAELICLAGFMRLLSAGFTERWAGRILNIHPALLPAFPGLHTHERALAAGVKLHGATVHFVTPALDAGPIVAQAAVPVRDDDDPDALAARVLAVENRLYPEALRLVASGRARVAGGVVRISGPPLPEPETAAK